MICEAVDCENPAVRGKYCCHRCAQRTQDRNRRARERANTEVKPLTDDELYQMKQLAHQDHVIPLRIREEIIRLRQSGLGARPIGQRLRLGSDAVSRYIQEHPTECEVLPEVEVYDDLFQTFCQQCDLETYMWVLNETKHRMHLYCPDCEHNQYLVHPRARRSRYV